MKKPADAKTVTVRTELVVPTALEITAYLDEEGHAQITDVRVAHIQAITPTRVNEAMTDEDLAHLDELVRAQLAKETR